MITEFTCGNYIALENYYNSMWGLKRHTNNTALISKDGKSISFLTDHLVVDGTDLHDIAEIINYIKSYYKNKNNDN